MKESNSRDRQPQRRCIGCRHSDDQSALMRVVARDGLAVEATAPRLEGRGAYLHPGCAAVVLSRNAIQRALRGVELSVDLRRNLERLAT